MKTIQVHLDDLNYEIISTDKGKLSWREYFLQNVERNKAWINR